MGRSLDVMRQVIDRVGFPPGDLIYAISRPEVFCDLGKLYYLLNNLRERKDLKLAIENGIKQLFLTNNTKHIPAIRMFFEGRTLLWSIPAQLCCFCGLCNCSWDA